MAASSGVGSALMPNTIELLVSEDLAAQLDAEADAARLRSGGRAAYFSASVTASRRLHRATHMQAGGAPLCHSRVGPGRAA